MYNILSIGLNDGNRTHTQCATNICPTIRLRPTYEVNIGFEPM